MINWFAAALIAPALWAIVTVIDHNLINKVYPSALFGTLISGLFATVPAFLILQSPSIPLFYAITSIFAGSVAVFQYYTYFQALKLNSPSLVVAFFNLSAVLVPIFSYVLLSERLGLNALVGFGLVLIPSIILSFSAINDEHRMKALRLMLITIILYSLSLVIMKYVYDETNFQTGFGYFSLGHAVGIMLVLAFSKKARKVATEARQLSYGVFVLLMLIEIVSLSADLFQNIAISRGSVSLVTALESTQPIFVLLFAILFYPILPKLLPEALEGNKFVKLACMAVMVAGVFIINNAA